MNITYPNQQIKRKVKYFILGLLIILASLIFWLKIPIRDLINHRNMVISVYVRTDSPVKFSPFMSQEGLYENFFDYHIEDRPKPPYTIVNGRLYLKFNDPLGEGAKKTKYFYWTEQEFAELYKNHPEVRPFLDPQEKCYGVKWAGVQEQLPKEEVDNLPSEIIDYLKLVERDFKDQAQKRNIRTCDQE